MSVLKIVNQFLNWIVVFEISSVLHSTWLLGRTFYTKCFSCAALAHQFGLFRHGLFWLWIRDLQFEFFFSPTIEIHSQFVLVILQVKFDPGTPPSLTLKRKLNTKDSVLAEFDLTLKEKISMVLFLNLFHKFSTSIILVLFWTYSFSCISFLCIVVGAYAWYFSCNLQVYMTLAAKSCSLYVWI